MPSALHLPACPASGAPSRWCRAGRRLRFPAGTSAGGIQHPAGSAPLLRACAAEAGLLLPDGWLRRVLAMESYDVIANQPVVIDNVSAGGRASWEPGGREGPAGRNPFVIGDGRALPAAAPPLPRRPGRRLGPSYSAVRCILAGRRWGGAAAVRRTAIGCGACFSPAGGPQPLAGGEQPPAPPRCQLAGRGGASPLVGAAVNQWGLLAVTWRSRAPPATPLRGAAVLIGS